MQLAELTVRGFADLLGSDAPAPGGGSAAPPRGLVSLWGLPSVAHLVVPEKNFALLASVHHSTASLV